MNKFRLPLLAAIGALTLVIASYSIGQATRADARGTLKICGAANCATNASGFVSRPLDSLGLPATDTGHYVEIPYGSLTPAIAPVLLLHVVGFGTVTATRCDSHGNSEAVFTNTTSHSLISFYSQEEIPPGGTVNGENGFLLLLVNGKGPDSSLDQIEVNSWNRKDKHVCGLFAGSPV